MGESHTFIVLLGLFSFKNNFKRVKYVGLSCYENVFFSTYFTNPF